MLTLNIFKQHKHVFEEYLYVKSSILDVAQGLS